MFRDADPRSFAAIYVVCGRTDMRYGIDSLAAIIEARLLSPKQFEWLIDGFSIAHEIRITYPDRSA